MTNTAEQMDRDRFRQGGLRDGRNAEQARCEGILRRTMASGGTLLDALAAIEKGDDNSALSASPAMPSTPATTNAPVAAKDMGDIVAARFEALRGRVFP